jgi:type IV secretory pathway VirJ component
MLFSNASKLTSNNRFCMAALRLQPASDGCTFFKMTSEEHAMKRTITSGLYIAVVGCALLATGCSSSNYYKVTDPTSGKAYYAEEVKTDKGTGAIKLKDARSKAEVTLQNSEVLVISKDEFKAATAAPATAPAAAAVPAPAPAPAAPAAVPAPEVPAAPAPEAAPAAATPEATAPAATTETK